MTLKLVRNSWISSAIEHLFIRLNCCGDLPTRTINVLLYGHPSIREASTSGEEGISPLPLGKQGGFIQGKENAKTLVLSPQTPSAEADATRTNEFGAKSKSPLKWTEWFLFRCMKPPCFTLGEGVPIAGSNNIYF